MSHAYDWRSPITAKQLMQLDREQFAIEFLRRNPAYAEDYRDTLDRTPPNPTATEISMAGLARRWRLSFPACTGYTFMGISWLMAAGVFSLRCDGRRSAKRIRRLLFDRLRRPVPTPDECRNSGWSARPDQ